MNRRSFLKALGFGAGAAVVAPSVLAELAEAAPHDPMDRILNGLDVDPEFVRAAPNTHWSRNEITVRAEPFEGFVTPDAYIRLHGLDDPRPVQFTASSGGTISNSNEIVWTSMPYSGDFTAWSLWTEPRGGKLLMSGPAYANRVVAGDMLHISPGSLRVSLHSA